MRPRNVCDLKELAILVLKDKPAKIDLNKQIIGDASISCKHTTLRIATLSRSAVKYE
jgi:hypothetical protein